MKKRITAGLLAASYLTFTTVTPVWADTSVGSQSIKDENAEIDNDVRTNETTGVSVSATDEGNGDISVEVSGDINVESKEDSTSISGLDVHHERSNESGDINVDVYGDINVSNESSDEHPSTGTGIQIDNNGKGDVSVTANSVTSSSSTDYAITYGINSQTSKGNTSIEISEDVSADSTTGNAFGLNSETSGGSTSFEIWGDLNADSEKGLATGASIFGYNADQKGTSNTDATVYGEIYARSNTSDAVGANLNTRDGSTASLFADDGIYARSGYSTATGLLLEAANGKAYADVFGEVYAVSDEGSANGVTVVLNGERSKLEANIYDNITALGDNASSGIQIQSNMDLMDPLSETPKTTATVYVLGDVESSGTGILDLDTMNSGKTDVVIEGTLNSNGPAVTLAKGSAQNLNLTVWKIESNQNKGIAMEQTETGLKNTKEAQDFEKTIDYILKVDPETDGSVKFLNSQVKEMTDHDGVTYDYNVAHAGDKISMKLNVPAGYYIVAAYSDEAQHTSLRKNIKGEYYLTVPKYGGVMISLKMAALRNDNDSDDHDDGGTPPEGYGEEQTPQVQTQTTELTPSETKVDRGILTANADKANSAVLSADTLDSFLKNGGKQFCLRTMSGEFILSADMLRGLNPSGQALRLVFTGQSIEIYIGTSEKPATTIAVTSSEAAPVASL